MEQQSLFERAGASPLAARMRPQTLDEFVGQKHLLGPGKVLRRLIESDRVSSMIFWGPPGVGKTTPCPDHRQPHQGRIHRLLAPSPAASRRSKQVMQQAEDNRRYGERTIVFVDEIHRFNKAQQDAFLPFVEKGSIILIGATTENPSFEVNGALLSRCKVFVLQSLTEQDLTELLTRALHDPRGFGNIRRSTSPPRCSGPSPALPTATPAPPSRTLEMVVLNGESDNSERCYCHRGDAGAVHLPQVAAVRQKGRGALQPDLRAAQVHAQLRPGRGGLLAGADAGGRGGPPVRGAAA